MDRKTGEITHTSFGEIVRYINSGDCLVLNDTKVIPARLMGVRQTGGVIELLLLKRLGGSEWEALARPAKRVRMNDVISFGDSELKARVTGVYPDGIRHVEMQYDGVFEEILDRLGEMPLPPYITKRLDDKNRYQTVYAKNAGSAAAPTAGFHFTDEILGRLSENGVKIAKVTLHVGLGTFRPIKEQNLLEHEMHLERYRIDEKNAEIINSAKKAGGKIICVGTTSVRTLETAASESGEISACEGETGIFIYPGYKFKLTDRIITNFHLPESTLIALVAAFAGTDCVMEAYRQAVERKYRFYSFGDCCMIL